MADVSAQPLNTYNPQGILGHSPLPGETWSQFLQRTGAYQGQSPQAMSDAEDAFKVQALQNQEAQTSQSALDQQTALQKSRLSDLATALANQTDTQFNLDIPKIANTAQNQGMLETSGFGEALANDKAQLVANNNATLTNQALADRDLAITGVGNIANNTNALATGGLQRTFSIEDQDKANALAKELAAYGIPAPAAQPSTFEKGLQYAGPILSGVGAVKGA